LKGNYRPEHLFSLRQAVELYDVYQTKIADYDRQILKQLKSFDDSPDAMPPAAMGDALVRMSGVDLTSIDGIDTTTALKILSEVGTDMSRFASAKHFASWLGLSPGTKVSGGKVLSSATKPVANKAAQALLMAAFTLFNSKSALGAYLRRQRARLGTPKAITATAHKLARLIYAMLTHGTAYVDAGQDYYERGPTGRGNDQESSLAEAQGRHRPQIKQITRSRVPYLPWNDPGVFPFFVSKKWDYSGTKVPNRNQSKQYQAHKTT
jgi:transposase